MPLSLQTTRNVAMGLIQPQRNTGKWKQSAQQQCAQQTTVERTDTLSALTSFHYKAEYILAAEQTGMTSRLAVNLPNIRNLF